MDKLLTSAGGAGGGGLLGAVLAWLGFKTKIQNIERRIDNFSEDVRYKDTCEEIQKALNRRLKNIESLQKESRTDIRTILSNSRG